MGQGRKKAWVWIGGLLLVLGLWIGTPFSLAQDEPPDAVSTGYPVELGGEVLFEIEETVGSFSAKERAIAVSQRLKAIATDDAVTPQDLKVEEAAGVLEIVVDDQVIVTITPADAEVVGRSSPALALEYRDQLREAIADYRNDRTPRALLFAGLYALIATLVLSLLLYLLGRIFPWLYRQINQSRESHIPALRLQRLEQLAERLVDVLLAVVKVLRTVLTIVLCYLYLTLVLSFFPWTRGVGAILLGYVAANVKQIGGGFIAYVPNLVTIVTVAVVAYYAIRLLRLIFTEIERDRLTIPGFYPEWANPTFRLALVLIIALALVICLPYLPGFDSPAFQGLSLFLGVLFSLGSTAVVANVVAGVILIYTRSFQEGDRVQIVDVVGMILEKNLLVTRIVTPKNVVVTIPNASVLSGNIINYSSASHDRRIAPLVVHTTITLGYDVPWHQVEMVLVAAATATPEILAEPAPFVLQTSLDDFYVSYELNAHTASPSQLPRIYSELHKNIQDGCNGAGIEILSPHYAAVRDGHHTTIPADYLPANYEAPRLRLDPLQQWLRQPPGS
ncbi:MAG: mechanosensitive ion channel domain-containing protein [Cyanobacteria bacterium P01_G01_bin.54]